MVLADDFGAGQVFVDLLMFVAPYAALAGGFLFAFRAMRSRR